MSYVVLARKYRPQAFDELIGQGHITDILKKTITTGRIAHAYLFCGPRGIGKTSLARIFAMCLNCEDGPRVDPDINSPTCRDIARGSSMDVLEIDGASNRGIDEIRALRENVKFAPSFGRYKIYIIDEVHMLTMEAFNALLKTLEEPPPHVKFIFATTDPNKVPATILSRCQRFDFKRIAVKTIVDVLKGISEKEKLNIDDEALFAVAKAGQGSLRDAVSVLDQVGALSDRRIAASDVYSMLGLVETQLLFDLTDAIAQKEGARALDIVGEIIDKGKDIKQLYRDLIDHFRNLMVIKVGGAGLGKLVDYPANIKDQILEQSGRITLKEMILAVDIFIQAQESSRITESLRLPLEVALAKLTYSRENDGLSASPPGPAAAKPAAPAPVAAPKPAAAVKKNSPGPGDETVSHPQAIHLAEPHAEPAWNLDKIRRMWDSLTHAVSREKMSVATFLQEGLPINFTDEELVIGFPAHASFQMESLERAENKRLIQKAFEEKLKIPVKLRFAVSEQHPPAQEDHSIQAALETFEGKVINRWHND